MTKKRDSLIALLNRQYDGDSAQTLMKMPGQRFSLYHYYPIFDLPKGKNGKPGKIAVKVINHYGDEVLKVYEVMWRAISVIKRRCFQNLLAIIYYL